jgi:membrane protease subunit (stomatin/prohibitin family)
MKPLFIKKIIKWLIENWGKVLIVGSICTTIYKGGSLGYEYLKAKILENQAYAAMQIQESINDSLVYASLLDLRRGQDSIGQVQHKQIKALTDSFVVVSVLARVTRNAVVEHMIKENMLMDVIRFQQEQMNELKKQANKNEYDISITPIKK